jgi:uncharacterized membrane protein YfcA
MFTSAVASVSHWQLGNMSWDLALPLSTSFLVGSLIANSFGGKLKSDLLEKLLGATLIAASATIIVHVIWF